MVLKPLVRKGGEGSTPFSGTSICRAATDRSVVICGELVEPARKPPPKAPESNHCGPPKAGGNPYPHELPKPNSQPRRLRPSSASRPLPRRVDPLVQLRA